MKSLFAVGALVAVTAGPSIADGDRTVATVNAPLAYIASVLVGDAVKVVFPAPDDVDPAHWRPGAEEVRLYQQSDLILLNGAGYAGWTEAVSLPRARLVNTTEAVRDQLIPAEAEPVTHKHGPEGEHSHSGSFAFTTWLDPEIAKAQAKASAEAMSQRWPDLAPSIAERGGALEAEIEAMGEVLKAFFESAADRQILASHPVYQYLAAANSVEIMSFHWEPRTAPSEKEWRFFEEEINLDHEPLMLWEGEPLETTRERLQALGVEVIVLDPMRNAVISEPLFENLARQVGVM